MLCCNVRQVIASVGEVEGSMTLAPAQVPPACAGRPSRHLMRVGKPVRCILEWVARLNSGCPNRSEWARQSWTTLGRWSASVSRAHALPLIPARIQQATSYVPCPSRAETVLSSASSSSSHPARSRPCNVLVRAARLFVLNIEQVVPLFRDIPAGRVSDAHHATNALHSIMIMTAVVAHLRMSCSASRRTVTVSESMFVCAISSGRLTTVDKRIQSATACTYTATTATGQNGAPGQRTKQAQKVLDAIDVCHLLALPFVGTEG